MGRLKISGGLLATVIMLMTVLFSASANAAAPAQNLSSPAHDDTPIAQDIADERDAALNLRDRQSVTLFYRVHYQIAANVELQWTGNVETCDPGTADAAFVEAVNERINFYRRMAGLAPVTLDPVYNASAQKAALITTLNGLNHKPPASSRCYSAEAAQAAANSHLYLGRYGPAAIDGYIQDHDEGFHNNYHVGHRRWILLPQLRKLGTGDFPGSERLHPANALWVVDASMRDPRPETRDGFVAWPPPGYVPYPVVYPRWSFSYPDADFSEAEIHMQVNGVEMGIEVEPLYEWRPTEPTLVWLPSGMDSRAAWPRPSQDTTYTITISNVYAGGRWFSFSYEVTVFDPDQIVSQAVAGLPLPTPQPQFVPSSRPGPPFLAR